MPRLKAPSASASASTPGGGPLFDDGFLRKLEYLYIVSQKIFGGQYRAQRKTQKVSSGIEFADYRDYAPGDDLRYIDWNIFSRTEKLVLRLFEEEEDLFVYFLLDTSVSMTLGSPRKLDYAKRLIASLAYIALSNMDNVSVIPFSASVTGRLPPTRGKAQIFKIFKYLESVSVGQHTEMREAFKTFATQNPRRGVAVIVSDFYDPDGYAEALNALRYQKFEVYVLHLFDDLELKPALRGDIELVDCETGEVRSVTVTPRLIQQYAQMHRAYCDEIEDFCLKRRMLYFRTPIQIPFDELVLRVFRAGGFLK
jgi:uncharacterized protein (DUF58 family)